MKCRTIDRLAFTRARCPNLKTEDRKHYEQPVAENVSQHREGYSTCPSCGQETLIHEDGCMHCRSCGWSACG